MGHNVNHSIDHEITVLDEARYILDNGSEELVGAL